MRPTTDSASPHGAPAWRRWLAGVLLMLALVAAMLVAGWANGTRSSAARLREIMAHLDATDPGWRMDEMEAARPELPQAENSARVILAIRKAAPRGWLSNPVGELDKAAGPPARLPGDEAELLGRTMALLAPVIVEARRLSAPIKVMRVWRAICLVVVHEDRWHACRAGAPSASGRRARVRGVHRRGGG